MGSQVTHANAEAQSAVSEKTAFNVLTAISFCHLLNDMVQSLIPALYPILKNTYHLDFAQIGFITLTNQATASLLQPVVGYYTDRNPKPYSLAFGMTCTFAGILLLAVHELPDAACRRSYGRVGICRVSP